MDKIIHIYDNSNENKNKFVPITIPVFKKVTTVEQKFCAIGDKKSNKDADHVITSIKGMFFLFKIKNDFNKVILHSCLSGFYGVALYIFLLFIEKNKIYMVLQGGEVNFINRDSIRDKAIFTIRKLIMKRVGTFVTNIKSDYLNAISIYNLKAKHIDGGGFYLSNIIYQAELRKKNKKILIGSSALPRNNHKIIIDKLAKKKWLYDYECIIPLSYGDKNYAKEVEEYAKNKLTSKVTCLYDFMSLSSYLEFISDVEIAFFYHEGQQGMGNIYNLLATGTKIYLYNDSYQILTNMGFKVCSYGDVNNSIKIEDCRYNIELINALFSESVTIDKISKVFKNECI